jgi:hypothetical protein
MRPYLGKNPSHKRAAQKKPPQKAGLYHTSIKLAKMKRTIF